VIRSTAAPSRGVNYRNNIYRALAHAMNDDIWQARDGKDPRAWNNAGPAGQRDYLESSNRTHNPPHDTLCGDRVLLSDVVMDSLQVGKRSRLVANDRFVKRSSNARTSSALA
jgi:hypothetical protein